MDTFEKHLHLPVTKIDDAERMMALLKARARQPAPLPAPEARSCAREIHALADEITGSALTAHAAASGILQRARVVGTEPKGPGGQRLRAGPEG